ncbi:MAG: tyrosine-type recombinase/integrase [Patescibacteria group bacterium]
MTLSQAIERYFIHCKSFAYSEQTIRCYYFILKRFVLSAGNLETEKITIADVENFMAGFGDVKVRTTRLYLTCIRSLSHFCFDYGIQFLDSRKIKLPRQKKNETVKDEITEDEFGRLRAVIDLSSDIGVRNRTIIELLRYSGCRISELCGLEVQNINFERREFCVKGKGGGMMYYNFTPEVSCWLKRWLSIHDTSQWVFCAFNNGILKERPIGTFIVRQSLKKLRQKAGIEKRITPHAMRHLFATDWDRNGGNIFILQKLLNHSKITTTQTYVDCGREYVRKKYDEFFINRISS